MKPRLAIIIGHSKEKPGAVSACGLTEYAYNLEVAQSIWDAAEKTPEIEVRPFYRNNKTILQVANEVNVWTKDAPKSLAVELHANSCDNPSVVGTEVLFDENPVENRLIARQFINALCTLFKQKNRGIKPLSIGDRGHMSMQVLSCPSVILEPLFLSNVIDAGLLRRYLTEYAETILDTSCNFLGGN